MLENFRERRDLAARLRDLAAEQAEVITEELLRKNPQWLEQFGEAARKSGIEDTAYHLQFLASAVEAGAPEAFAEYARWTTRVLASRDIAPEMLAESLLEIPESLAPELNEEQGRIVREVVERAAAECTAKAVVVSDPRERMNDLQSTYLQAILEGDRRAAQQIAIEALDAGLSLADLYRDVLQECMYAIGELWETNQISVADEHMATAITQTVMAEVYQRVPWSDESKGRVVLTGVQGEMHQIGAHLVADTLDINGWDVMFLGADVPHDDVLMFVEKHEAEVLGISATMLTNIGRVTAMIDHVRERFNDDLRVIVGGAAFGARPDLWQEIGADGYALDLADAVRTISKLTDEHTMSD